MTLEELRAEFGAEWRLWRAHDGDRLASWCASARLPGVDPLVMRDTAEQLREALLEQREQAAERTPVRRVVVPCGRVHTTGRHLWSVR